MALSYKKITPFDTSFGLVRTNPKLTGNVKLVVDSSQNLYFESIEASSELANDKYKAYPIDPTSNHDSNLYRFFSNGNTPESIVFGVKTNVALDSTSSNFADQYDFSEYFSGARYCISKNYSEKFKYFAPIYLNKEVPEKFVIFKIPGASHLPISETKASYPYAKAGHLKSILDDAQIIKTFDLGVDSHIGKYLKKMQSNPLFPSTTLNFPFNRGLLASYSGVAYKVGCYTEKFENLQDLIIGGKTITDFEEYVTLGYERNSVIYPNILNLEFLFDDTSDDFEFNRYFGIYCNTVDLAGLGDQTLSLNTSSNVLTISDGNTVDFTPILGGSGASSTTVERFRIDYDAGGSITGISAVTPGISSVTVTDAAAGLIEITLDNGTYNYNGIILNNLPYIDENVFEKIVTEHNISNLFTQKEWTSEEEKINSKLKNHLQNIKFHEVYDQFLFHPDDIPYEDINNLPQVFTTFRKECEKKVSVIKTVSIEPKTKENLINNNTQIPTILDLGFEEFETHNF